MMPAWLRRQPRHDPTAADGVPAEGWNVLVTLSGNSMDEDLVRVACTMAKRTRGHVIAITVVEVPRTLALDAEVIGSRAEEILEGAIAAAHDLNVHIESEVVQAREAGPAIVDEANDRHCRLILLGLDSRSRFGQFDLGKTVPYVLEHARGRVWIARDERGDD